MKSIQIKSIQIKSNQINQSIYLSVYIPIYLSIHPSIHPFTYLSLYAQSLSLFYIYTYVYTPYLCVCAQCANIFSPLYICGPITPIIKYANKGQYQEKKNLHETAHDSASIIIGTWNDFKHSGHVDTILQPYLQQFPPKNNTKCSQTVKTVLYYTKLWGLLCFYYGCLDTGNIRKPFLGRDAIEDPSCSSPPWETSGLGPYHGILLPLPPLIGRIPAVFMFFVLQKQESTCFIRVVLWRCILYIYIY